MAKIEQYFTSKAELDAYYPNGVPSTVLAIVQEQGNVTMYTYDNNGIAGGAEIGGYPADYDEAVELSTYTLVGED